MDKKKAQELFDKYQSGNCSPEEKLLLESFLESFQNESKTKEAILSEQDTIADELWLDFQHRLSQDSLKGRGRLWLKLAAAIAILIGLYGLGTWWVKEEVPQLQFPENRIVLTTDSGAIPLTESGKVESIDFDGLGKAIHHQNSLSYEKGSATTLVYNELRIPHGKTFSLELSDGTAVRLNAGSSIKFPVKFGQTGQRQVSITGEAYLDVAKDAERPFVVAIDGMQIEVLGTAFGVNSFAKENYVVLVEGRVQVGEGDGSPVLNLVPGEMAALSSSGIQKQTVDPNDYLDWTQGIFRFRDQAFGDIVSGIERRYNVSIINDFKAMEQTRFSGRFTDEDIYEVLEVFQESVGFDYHIAENKIYIYNPKNN
ncbi:FecR family protein [Sediminicola luteus]|uniref:Iron dicitrate transport regulator FecR n=1 Tax=Sediminicola luteus TaxID=319238 RepID=A0A2A4GC62_9FLAO|nr:FecR domain-containing protein [Sediminicola luteus]PCE66043.1 hypothetical protein B7P33_01715 [Sediminicola luteus]